MRKTIKEHKIGSFFVLLIFCIFIFSVLFVLMFGARIYNRVSQRNESSLASRTCVQYIVEKIHQFDTTGGVYVAPFSDDYDDDALYLAQEIEGLTYTTRIYYYDGCVYELFSEAGYEFSPSDGNKVIAAELLNFSQNGNLITITAQGEGGGQITLPISLNCGKGASQ